MRKNVKVRIDKIVKRMSIFYFYNINYNYKLIERDEIIEV